MSAHLVNGFDLKPREQLEKIVADISKSLELIDVHIELASDRRSHDLVDFISTHFIGEETITKSLGIKVTDTIRPMLLERYSQNLSLLLICDVTNEVIGCRTIKFEPQTLVLSRENLSENVKTAYRFLTHKDAEMDVCRYYNVDKFAWFINLGVRKDFRQKGLGTKLMDAALQLLSQMGPDSICVRGEASANYSQRIYEKFGFTLLHSMKYEEYLENGKVAITNTGDNKTCNVYVKKVERQL